MPQRMYLVTDPSFAEYVYYVMTTSTQDMRASLDVRELQYFDNEKSIRRFADNESLEKRLVLLARMGVSYTITCSPPNTNFEKVIGEVETLTTITEKEEYIRNLADNKIFVLSSKDLLMVSQMSAMNSHTQVYILDYSYVKLHQKLLDCYRDTLSVNINNSIRAFEDMSKIVLSAMATADIVQGLAGVSILEMQVLLAMLPYRNQPIRATKVSQLIHDTARSVPAKNALKRLEDMGHVARLKTSKREEQHTYTILEKGIMAANSWIKYILKKSELT